MPGISHFTARHSYWKFLAGELPKSLRVGRNRNGGRDMVYENETIYFWISFGCFASVLWKIIPTETESSSILWYS